MVLTEQHNKVVHVPDEGVQGLGGDVLDDVLLIPGRLVRYEPLQHILFSAQFSWKVQIRKKELKEKATVINLKETEKILMLTRLYRTFFKSILAEML